MTRHFLKTLTIFTVMIILGLVGIFILNYFDKEAALLTDVNNKTEVAK